LQVVPEKPVWQKQEPLVWTVPLPLHRVASEYWHAMPAKPAAQLQVPLLRAVPLPLQVVASEY
jgi:hypothetical protein